MKQCKCQRCRDLMDCHELEAFNYVESRIGPRTERQRRRENAKLYQGIAKAISEQPHGETNWDLVQ